MRSSDRFVYPGCQLSPLYRFAHNTRASGIQGKQNGQRIAFQQGWINTLVMLILICMSILIYIVKFHVQTDQTFTHGDKNLIDDDIVWTSWRKHEALFSFT